MDWEEILKICSDEKESHIEGYSLGFKQKECDGLKFTDGVIRINEIFTIRHIYKIQRHGNMLWINDNNIIIGLEKIDDFQIL